MLFSLSLNSLGVYLNCSSFKFIPSLDVGVSSFNSGIILINISFLFSDVGSLLSSKWQIIKIIILNIIILK